MQPTLDELRTACAAIAQISRHVRIEDDAIAAYAAALPLPEAAETPDRAIQDREELAAFWLALDAINFGSGWFPTLKKRPGYSGYETVAAGVRDHFAKHGAWSALELQRLDAPALARALQLEPDHELTALFADSLNDIGRNLELEHGGSFAELADVGEHSAVELALHLGSWDCFADCSRYGERRVPFLKRAQIAAADLTRAGVIAPPDLGRLTMFADNLVPHVLRLDGILRFDPELTERIDREELIEHGSPEEIEIRACALHAVELIVAQRPGTSAAQVDELLWSRGRGGRYKALPRHRSRCTAY